MAVTTHAAVQGSDRKAQPGARALGPSNPNSTIEVLVKLRRKKELPDLTGRPAKAMTRDELAADYGASQKDIDAVVQAFAKFGLTKVAADAATRTVRLSGSVAKMEAAFQVKLFDYAHPSGNYRGRVGRLHVPIELHQIVRGVFGLDNRRVARRRRQPVSDTAPARSVASPPAAGWYIPSQLASHYNFPPGDGGGQTVGIIEFGGGYFPDDLQQFCSMAGVAMPTVNVASTDGISTSRKDGQEGEVMLDIEVVAGICPKATIAVYFAHFTEHGWITVLDATVQDKVNNPGALSISWGYAEDADIWTAQAMNEVNEALKEAAVLGITVCVAAGDDGSSDAISDGNAHVDFPSSSPYALAVGGTTITALDGSQADICWKEGDGLRADSGGSTGGGVSAVFARPNWQEALTIQSVNPGAMAGRCVPDLAADADWNASPYLLVVDGGAQPNGRTSAATPLIASLITLINAARPSGQRIGYLTPVLYQPVSGGGIGAVTIGQTGCTDVVAGDNTTAHAGGYAAGPGYDAVSGWGTPNGQKLLAALPAP
ncbi:MAG TPA: S53 family peptidase [Stellaceae bacterium]|nr:S53 family peptidase [Stellaceae bacterium]